MTNTTPVPRLVLVEGVPGVGKSSLAQLVCRRLRDVGQKALWLREEAVDHPVRLPFDPARHGVGDLYIAEAAAAWRRYAEQVAADAPVVVADAALLQNHLRSMLVFDCGRQSLLDLVSTVEQAIDPLPAALIRLNPGDLDPHFADVACRRGQRMIDLWISAHDQYPYAVARSLLGRSGVIAFWEAFETAIDDAWGRLTMNRVEIAAHPDARSSASETALRFLGLPIGGGCSAAAGLARFAGEYRARVGQRVCRVEVDGGCLIAVTSDPDIDVSKGPIGCFQQVRLLPNAGNVFYAEGWLHEVRFLTDASGEITAMRVDAVGERDLSANVYDKTT